MVKLSQPDCRAKKEKGRVQTVADKGRSGK